MSLDTDEMVKFLTMAVIEGRKQGLEEAAGRVEQMGGRYRSLLSPDVAAREIRALKDK
jgi:hypothetical protein